MQRAACLEADASAGELCGVDLKVFDAHVGGGVTIGHTTHLLPHVVTDPVRAQPHVSHRVCKG